MRPMRCFVGQLRFVYISIMHHDSANATFWGLHGQQGLWPPNSNSAEIFVQCIYPPSSIILCLLVRKLSCWHTNKQTNKQTDAAENIQRSSLCYNVGNNLWLLLVQSVRCWPTSVAVWRFLQGVNDDLGQHDPNAGTHCGNVEGHSSYGGVRPADIPAALLYSAFSHRRSYCWPTRLPDHRRLCTYRLLISVQKLSHIAGNNNSKTIN